MQLSAMMQTLEAPCFSAMPPDATMAEAVAILVRKNQSAVAVMDKGQLKGLVTRTDVLKALVPTPGSKRNQQPLSGIMTKTLVVAGPQQSFQQALERMSRSKIEHLPVLHEDRLLTVLHESDILRHRIKLLKADVIHLHEYIEGLHNAEHD
ncbi:MAG: CBS domain-containing protein [Desulfobacteraceae bacterium]